MKAAAGAGYATATDLADWLVRAVGVPFREAHHVTGRIVAHASERRLGLDKVTLAAMQAIEPRIHDGVFAVLGVDRSVRSRTELWRHGAGQCPPPGAALGQGAGQGGRGLLPGPLSRRLDAGGGRIGALFGSRAWADRVLSTIDDRRPQMPRHAMSLAMILAVAAALAVAGCGRKGRLEPPPGQQLVTKDGKTQDPGPVKPKKSFFLDPLLN